MGYPYVKFEIDRACRFPYSMSAVGSSTINGLVVEVYVLRVKIRVKLLSQL